MLDPLVIEADPQQPRRDFDPSSLYELMESIGEIGLVEPLVVTPAKGGKFILVAGERRLRACRMGRKQYPDNPHFQKVPVRIRRMESWSGLARLRAQLDENRIREGLQPGEMAVAYRNAKLTLECEQAEQILQQKKLLPEDYTADASPIERQRVLKQVLQKAGIAWPTVSWSEVFKALGQPMDRRVLAILKIASPVLQRCDELGLTKTAVATISSLKDEAKQMAVLDAVAKYKDRGLVAPLVNLMTSDPSLHPDEALQAVLKTRQILKTTSKVPQSSPETKKLNAASSKQSATAAEYDQATDYIRSVLDILESRCFTKYQAGSLQMLLDRAKQAIQAAQN